MLYDASLPRRVLVLLFKRAAFALRWRLAVEKYWMSGLLDMAIVTPCSHNTLQLSMVSTALSITKRSVADKLAATGAGVIGLMK